MSTRELFEDATKARVRDAIGRIEQQTSAEIVVTVRGVAGSYRDADFAFGALLAFVTLAVLIYAEREFSTALIPLDVALAFVLGAFVCSRAPNLRRALLGRKRRRASVRAAAVEAFHSLRIARTSGRNGILVLASVLEREVSVVWDLGIDPDAMGPAFRDAVARLEQSIARANPHADDFIAALEALGPALATQMPRKADDVNELSDEVA